MDACYALPGREQALAGRVACEGVAGALVSKGYESDRVIAHRLLRTRNTGWGEMHLGRVGGHSRSRADTIVYSTLSFFAV